MSGWTMAAWRATRCRRPRPETPWRALILRSGDCNNTRRRSRATDGKGILARREEPRACTHVFDKQHLAVGAEYTGDLAQSAFGVRDGAQHKRRDDGVH